MTKVTIKEIARRAGVSKGAVSYALNGRPGVSESTRARVLEVAAELDWVPNSAARSLSGAKTQTVGLVVARPVETLAAESFFAQFLAGLESELGPRGHALLLQVVPARATEEGALRAWARERRVDGVVLLDPRVEDPRLPLVEALGLPAVVVGHPSLAGALPCVWKDDADAVERAVEHLAGLGHQVVARVGGPSELGHTTVRDRAFASAVAAAGVRGVVRHTDFSGEEAARTTRELVVGPDAVTALVYDNDLMAVAGLSALAAAGVAVPQRASLVAWDDSTLCQVTHPRLTAVGHDLVGYGAAVADLLLRSVDARRAGAPAVADVRTATPELRVRASTAPPSGRPTRPPQERP